VEHYPYLAANSRSALVRLLEVFEVWWPISVFTKASYWESSSQINSVHVLFL